MYGGEPPLKVKPMKKALLGLVALPIALIGGTESAMAYGLGNWNSYLSPNSYTINSPGNYSGTYKNGIYSSFIPRVSIHDQVQVGKNALGKPVYLDTGRF